MKKYKGFTLVEVLVVSLITGFLGVGVVNVIANSNKIINESVRQSFLDNQINFVMEEITKDIKEGYRLDLPSTYSYEITITQSVNGADEKITWKYKYLNNGNDYGYFPVRIANDGTEKMYKIRGLESKRYKYMVPTFTFPTGYTATFKPGKFFGVNVRMMSYFDLGGKYWSTNTQSSVYCRTEEDGILY